MEQALKVSDICCEFFWPWCNPVWTQVKLQVCITDSYLSNSFLLNFSEFFPWAVFRGLKRRNYLFIYTARVKNEDKLGKQLTVYLLSYPINHCAPRTEQVLTPELGLTSLKYKVGLYDPCSGTSPWPFSAFVCFFFEQIKSLIIPTNLFLCLTSWTSSSFLLLVKF